MESYSFSVKDTNLEALRAKKSAVECGYMRDAFINYFVPEHIHKEILMHRGYWARYWCFNSIVTKFVQNAKTPVQVISIGCGLDTLPFNLLNQQTSPNFIYFECDLRDVVQQKIDVIVKNQEFINFIRSKSSTELVIHQGQHTRLLSSNYRLFECDLNTISTLESTLAEVGVDPS